MVVAQSWDAVFARPSLVDTLRTVSAEALMRRSAMAIESAMRQGCWIYGAGGYGQLIYRLLTDRAIEVCGFIDRRAGKGALNLPVRAVTPDAIAQIDAEGATLVVAVHNFAADQASVVAWGRSAGFADIVIPAELPDVLGPEAGSYWLTGRAHTAKYLDQLERVGALLADAKSVAVLEAIARFRLTGDIADHPPSHLPSQYFPSDVPMVPEPLRMIDGGAYIGDAYDAALEAGARFDEWYAFEPDPVNFRALVETASVADVGRVALFPCGLGDACGQIRFSSGEAAGSHVAASGAGDSFAQIVALDQVLPGVRPNYVKLDIEGFEREAIAGMRTMLTKHRPQIAMSIYHKPEDLWELPLLIHDLLPDSKLYIRQHGFNGFDTVLYAVP